MSTMPCAFMTSYSYYWSHFKIILHLSVRVHIWGLEDHWQESLLSFYCVEVSVQGLTVSTRAESHYLDSL